MQGGEFWGAYITYWGGLRGQNTGFRAFDCGVPYPKEEAREEVCTRDCALKAQS